MAFVDVLKAVAVRHDDYHRHRGHSRGSIRSEPGAPAYEDNRPERINVNRVRPARFAGSPRVSEEYVYNTNGG